MWGEQIQDTRIRALALTWRGANFLRGTAAFMGGLPTPVDTAAWTPPRKSTAARSSSPQYRPSSCRQAFPPRFLAGSFAAGMNIPLDQQWVVGSYTPDAMDITNRTFVVSLTLKIDDGTLYKKMSTILRPAAAWAASLMREANFKVQFMSDIEADVGVPYCLTIKGNGQTDADANVVWSPPPSACARASRSS